MPPDVRFCNPSCRISKDHRYQQKHAHNREREDASRQTSPGGAGGFSEPIERGDAVCWRGFHRYFPLTVSQWKALIHHAVARWYKVLQELPIWGKSLQATDSPNQPGCGSEVTSSPSTQLKHQKGITFG